MSSLDEDCPINLKKVTLLRKKVQYVPKNKVFFSVFDNNVIFGQ